MRPALLVLVASVALLGAIYGILRIAFGHADFTQEAPDWEVVGVSGDRRTLTIAFATGDPACHDESVDVSESSSAVRVTVLVKNYVVDCTDIEVTYTDELRLRRPLGARRVVDATTGRRIGVVVCSPVSGGIGCDRPTVGVRYPMRLTLRCGVVVAYFDGRWWKTERPRPDPLGIDYGDPVFEGWRWKDDVDPEQPDRPAGLGWRREFRAFTIPGSMRLVSSSRAVFERREYRRVTFVPLAAREAPTWCGELRRA